MTFWSSINAAYNAVFNTWFALLSALPSWLQILVTALPVSVLALLVYRYASNQDGIHLVKDRIKGYLLELWLYKDDLGVMLHAQGRVMWYSLRYMGLALVPMAILIAPLAPVIVQLESRFAFRGGQPGENVIFTVSMGNKKPVSDMNVVLSLPKGVSAVTPVLRIDDSGQLLWRLRPETPGRYDISVKIDGQSFDRRLLVGPNVGALWPKAYTATDWRVLSSAAEPPLPAGSGVISTEIDYSRNRGEFLGLSSASWQLLLFTLIWSFLFRGLFGVTF